MKSINRSTDDVIYYAHPYYSRKFEFCSGSAEQRLEALFRIKERWTKGELESYLSPFIDLSVKLDTYLNKSTKMIIEKNPFDSSKDVALYYIKKF